VKSCPKFCEFTILLKKYPNTLVKNGIINHLFDAYVQVYSNQDLKYANKNYSDNPVLSDTERIKRSGALLIEIDPQHFNYHTVAEGFSRSGLFLDAAIVYCKKAISKLADNSNLHTPEYYYTLGRLYLQTGDNDSALYYLSFADSIINHVPDENYTYIDSKYMQKTRIKSGLAMTYMLMGSSAKAVSIYRELYVNNLDHESLEKKYESALLATGLDSMEVAEKLSEERTRYLNDISLKIEQNSLRKIAPDITFQDLNGTNVTLNDYKGKIVVLNFWAGWCAPCLVEMPMLEKLNREFSKYPVAIVAVNIDHNSMVKNYDKLIAEYDITFEILAAPSSVLSQFKVPPIPRTYILDKKGYIRYEHTGTSGSLHQQLRLELANLLAEL
jgi:thiol-disulfide isomerase/thioredoxin